MDIEGTTAAVETNDARADNNNNNSNSAPPEKQDGQTFSCRRTISFETHSCGSSETILKSPRQRRNVGYFIHEAKDPEHRNAAILWFYPLSGASVAAEYAAPSFENYEASVVCVDRPGIGGTDHCLPSNSKSHLRAKQQTSKSIDRIEQHAQDVLQVLKHHKEIRYVYLMGVCLGHAYAVQVARCLLPSQLNHEQNEENGYSIPTLKGLTLVAPFVSTACPFAWSFARFGGHYVPSWVLSAATSTMMAVGGMLIPSFVTPARVQSLIGETHAKEFGWTEDDFEQASQMIRDMSSQEWNGPTTKSIEANLGADPSWQQIMDDFALESGCGLIADLDEEGQENKDKQEYPTKKTSSSLPAFPIRIRATEIDDIAPYLSVKWVARRNYGGVAIIRRETYRIPSHEGMILLGGPPRNPILLHEIAQEWGLLRNRDWVALQQLPPPSFNVSWEQSDEKRECIFPYLNFCQKSSVDIEI